MKHIRNLTFVTMILVLLAASLAFNVGSVSAVQQQPNYTCLPTCEEDDGRFLAIAGVDLETLVGMDINIEIAAPAGTSEIEIGIFDGQTGGQWDIGTEPLEFTLFADPLGDGTGNVQIAQWSGSIMPDNAWFVHMISTGPEAESPSGNYFYRLSAHAPNPNILFANHFKVRADNNAVVSLFAVPFAYTASVTSLADLMTIYPDYPNLDPTTYNGDFNFHVYIPNSQERLVIWEGDADFGSWDLVDNDTDDPDTPNEPFLPPWATPGTAYEGVAVGYNGSTGRPSDDSQIEIFRRSPSVFYTVSPPAGFGFGDFINQDPSGNREWERFSIETDPSKLADIYVDGPLPSGLYHIHMTGMDMHNLNAWRFPYKVVGVCDLVPETPEPEPCKELPQPFLIGDTVFIDLNTNGVQDPNEPGRPGVVVYLLDGSGNPVLDVFNNPISAVTDANGNYFFEVEPGEYTVMVGAENFVPGGALVGMSSTTGGDEQTNTVIDSNVLDYDFGYMQNFPIGDPRTPGYWKNWASCTGGNQYPKTVFDVDPLNMYISLDEVLFNPGIIWDDILDDDFLFPITECEDAVDILDQRDLGTGKKRGVDAAYTLAMHLLAYHLNEGAGACKPDYPVYKGMYIEDVALEAETLLDSYDFNAQGDFLAEKGHKSFDYMRALLLKDLLDKYNNGQFCSG